MPSRPSSVNALCAPSLDELIESTLPQAQSLTGNASRPQLVVSPYRFNPLGAHVDHQGGSVLARCLDQYTLLYFWPRSESESRVFADMDAGHWQCAEFNAGDLDDQYGWDSMSRAAVSAFAEQHDLKRGINAVVTGTLVSGGLSSSASVVLAYIAALAEVNEVVLDARQQVELVRRVENDFRGLSNGVQDQMSIVFAQKDHLIMLDVESVTATAVADAATADEVSFIMCFSGVSRDLVTGSNFNLRVSECHQAAQALYSGARHLGEVPENLRSDACLSRLPAVARRRATHVYGEMKRVHQGFSAWAEGDWRRFGQLMNQSCFSSINHYESGSPWLIDLHEMASAIDGVYGSRFSGGGFGGCLFMLVNSRRAEAVADELMAKYLGKYPELASKARICLAQSENTVRIITP